MQKNIEFGQSVNETSVLFTTEECIVHIKALDLLEASMADPSVQEWALLETGATPLRAEQWVWDRCDILRADLSSAMSRFSRGYTAYQFNDDDSGFLRFALERLVTCDTTKLKDEHTPLAAFIPVARYVLAQCEETVTSAPISIFR